MRKQYIENLPEDWLPLAAVFSALGDQYRQRILLMFEPEERLTIKQVVEAMPLSRTAVVHHLQALISSGLLRSKKEGRDVYLTLNKDQLKNTLESVLNYMQSNT